MEVINKTIKAMELKRARRSIQYLETQLEKTSLVEMQVLHQLVESQTKTIMLAEALGARAI